MYRWSLPDICPSSVPSQDTDACCLSVAAVANVPATEDAEEHVALATALPAFPAEATDGDDEPVALATTLPEVPVATEGDAEQAALSPALPSGATQGDEEHVARNPALPVEATEGDGEHVALAAASPAIQAEIADVAPAELRLAAVEAAAAPT